MGKSSITFDYQRIFTSHCYTHIELKRSKELDLSGAIVDNGGAYQKKIGGMGPVNDQRIRELEVELDYQFTSVY